MKSIASLMIIAFLALVVNEAQAQEASIPLNLDAASEQLQRTPSLVIHEVVKPPSVTKPPSATELKTQGAPTKNTASKSSAAGASSATQPQKPIVVPTTSGWVYNEMGTTGNPKYDAMVAQSAAR